MIRSQTTHATLTTVRLDLLHARFDEALKALDTLDADPAALMLRARLYLRTNQALEALRVLLAAPRDLDAPLCAEQRILLGAAYGQTRDFQAGLREIEGACANGLPQTLRAEADYYTAYIHWLQHDNIAAEAALAPILNSEDLNVRARAKILHAWIAARRQDVQAHIILLTDALSDLERAGNAADVFYMARVLNTLSALCRETPLPDVLTRVRTAVPTLEWTSGVETEHFHILRSLAWIDALNGNEMQAYRQLKQASALAPNDAWRVLSLADKAYLARSFGELGFSADQLAEAHSLAQRIDWASTHGEERAALLVLAQLLAGTDPAEAVVFLNLFRGLDGNTSGTLFYATDARVRGFSAYSEGVARLGLGEKVGAEGLLREAWSIFEAFSYVWRSALTACHLFEITGDQKWIDLAKSRIAVYPHSWIARKIEEYTLESASAPYLTPAQEQVFDLLCEGASTNDIAARLQRSPHTVRNHISDIFEAYGVGSRAELFARLRKK